MLDSFTDFISKQKLFHPEQKILLAVSGGIDSMVMVDLFQAANCNYAIAHCNFNLRGQESDGDQELVQDTARQYQVACLVKSFDTNDYAKDHGISIQMAARDLRISWFDQLLDEEEYDFVALAHHLDDSLETVLFNLTKGTGIEGLKGIPTKNGHYIRPLLFATRGMIAEYAVAHRIKWREDQSNRSIKYHRNRIRNKVVPELKKINPSLEATYAFSRERIAAAARLYNKSIHKARQAVSEVTSGGLQVDKSKLKLFDEPMILLYEILKDYGFNFQQAKNILEIMDKGSGKRFYTDEYQLVIDRNFLFLFQRAVDADIEVTIGENTDKIELPDRKVLFEKLDVNSVKFSADNQTIFLDYDALSFPLKIRTWHPGDWFQPLGMPHKKKLSDFMIDKKIPLNLKNRVMVMTSGDNLVCVVGYRIDERYKITKNTRAAFMISNQYRDD